LNARQKHYNEAFEYYKLALDQYSHLSKDKGNRDSAEVKQHLARTLHNLGLLSFNLQQYEEAKKFYAQSLKIKSQVYKEEPDAPELALTLSKMSSVEVKQGNTDAAKYYQNQALKRSPTFLETHKKLINRHLLPATPEEAAALISMIPPDSPDYMDHEVIARSLDLWEGLRDINSHNRSKLCFGGGSHSYRSASLPGIGGEATKTCWYPLKNLREKKKKPGKKKSSNGSSNDKQERRR
jgi:tetratricopeptide (TPR) repeat protein